jgi:hypothetical protein
MKGIFHAMVIDDLGKGDAPFLEALKNQDIDGLLDRHPVVAEAKSENQVYQTVVQWFMSQLFGLPEIGVMDGAVDGGLRYVTLSQKATEPAYDDYSGTFFWRDDAIAGDSAEGPWALSSYLYAKRFINDVSESTRVWTDPDREGYYYRDRFLWLPSHGVFTDIRSIYALGSREPNWTPSTSSNDHFYASRTRLKDSGGNPITLQKSASQGFLVEYVIKLFSR